jgi:hypothetical protein
MTILSYGGRVSTEGSRRLTLTRVKKAEENASGRASFQKLLALEDSAALELRLPNQTVLIPLDHEGLAEVVVMGRGSCLRTFHLSHSA